jgi:hypothetical protein
MERGESGFVVADSPDSFHVGGGADEESGFYEAFGYGGSCGEEGYIDIPRGVGGEPRFKGGLFGWRGGGGGRGGEGKSAGQRQGEGGGQTDSASTVDVGEYREGGDEDGDVCQGYGEGGRHWVSGVETTPSRWMSRLVIWKCSR